MTEENRNPNWPHVIQNYDELYAAVDAGLLNVEAIGALEEAAGGTIPFLMGQVQEALKTMGYDNFSVNVGDEQVYRGSGAYKPIEVKDGETLITSFNITTALGGAIPDSMVGIMYIDDEGIQAQMLHALTGGGEMEE